MGVGLAPLPYARLSAEALAERLATVTQDQAMQARARQVGERIRAEDGLAKAVKVIEAYFGAQ
jgi:UDP:flavonoid glycosyltransferase YjiC (YdhE family)